MKKSLKTMTMFVTVCVKIVHCGILIKRKQIHDRATVVPERENEMIDQPIVIKMR